MLDIDFKYFFDKPAVLKKIKDGTQSVLAKAGSFVRTRAQRSIRPRKKSSAPGQPPSSHTGLLRSLIFFAYDPSSESVVIGPKLLSGSKRKGSATVPQLLEFGGAATHWKTGKPATYAKFPFMEPALEAERDQFAGLFRDAIKG